jgi:hypothetical protein
MIGKMAGVQRKQPGALLQISHPTDLRIRGFVL